jgi:hypothetical protein
MVEWEKILEMFWSKYYWDDDWLNVKYQDRPRYDRAWIRTPTTNCADWSVSLGPLRFDTHDEAINFLMGTVVFEDLLQKILEEHKHK